MRLTIHNAVTSALLSSLLLTASLPVMAITDNNCDAIKDDIAQRIINNGVPADGFTLNVVPNDEAPTTPGKQVGSCGAQQYKIFYLRQSAVPASEQPAPEEQ